MPFEDFVWPLLFTSSVDHMMFSKKVYHAKSKLFLVIDTFLSGLFDLQDLTSGLGRGVCWNIIDDSIKKSLRSSTPKATPVV